VTRRLRIENQFQPASRLIYIYIYSNIHAAFGHMFLESSNMFAPNPSTTKMPKMAVESTKNSGLAISESWSIWILNKKNSLAARNPKQKRGFTSKGMETGNLKVLHLNTPFASHC